MSSGGNLKLGDLVWAKMKGFPPWPGKVVQPTKELKKPSSGKKHSHWIFFFGTDNFAWIEENNLKPYPEFKEQFMKNRSGALRDAVEAIEHYIKKKEEDPQYEETHMDSESVEGPKSEHAEGGSTGSSPTPNAKPKPRSRPKNSNKRINSESAASNNGGLNSAPHKKPRRSVSADTSNAVPGSSLMTNHSSYRKPGVVSNFLDRPTGITKPDSVPLDVQSVSQTLRDKNIHPSTLKFGFLGLGLMGSGMVKNLLNSGHRVVVWNRTPEKCRDFVRAGAELGMTPSDVILAADVTFSCVADPQAAKEMVFGNCGVLQEVTTTKGYVEMTGVDAETSQDIAEAVGTKGGRYLEAQIQGSKTQAEEGTLVILAAGDRSLFDDCQSCFQAMGKNSFYLGEVGNASKMNLVLQLMAGVTLAGLAEGMALADRAGLQQKDVLEILELTSLACPAIVEKGRAIIEGGFPTHLPLQHMQKDLKLGLGMGDQLEQPLPLTASANEVFKHAKRLGYGEHDVSAVYIRARF